MTKKWSDIATLFIAILLCEFVGLISSLFTVSAIPNWYDGLVKPAMNPPNWVFGPVWTMLYALMGVAAFVIWKKKGKEFVNDRRTALSVFGVQLVLNGIWSIIFFGLQSPLWALVEIVLLWIAIVCTLIFFHRLSKTASFLLIPYVLWVSFAMYLNAAIWRLNP